MKPARRIEDVSCTRETAKALLCVMEDRALWIPKSVITDDSEVWREGDEGTLIVEEWWAERQELG